MPESLPPPYPQPMILLGGWLGWNGLSSLTGAINVASKLSLFLAELKRRKVYRVATVYVVVGAGIIGLGEANRLGNGLGV